MGAQPTLRALRVYDKRGYVGGFHPPSPKPDNFVPRPHYASRSLKLLGFVKAYSPHFSIRPAMVPSASQPVTSSSTFAESSEPFLVATP